MARLIPVTVSVVIPVKDDAGLLARCLEALAGQTVPADEIVVVDNLSTDDSAAVARRGGAKVIECFAPGIPAASSAGYDAAAGDLILRLDADCVPSPTWVETMVRASERYPEVAAFTGHARFIDGPVLLRVPLTAVYLGAYLLAAATALGHVPLFGSNAAFRADAWRRVSGSVHRDAALHDDFDLSFHLGATHRIRYLPHATMGMSMRPFHSGRAFADRFRRGVGTVTVHWPEDFPPSRWRRIVRHRRGLD